MIFKNKPLTENEITPQIIEKWHKRYEKDLWIFELNDKKGYSRFPTQKEVNKIVRNLTRNGKIFNETEYLIAVIKLCWLGGDKKMILDDAFIETNKKIWQTL